MEDVPRWITNFSYDYKQATFSMLNLTFVHLCAAVSVGETPDARNWIKTRVLDTLPALDRDRLASDFIAYLSLEARFGFPYLTRLLVVHTWQSLGLFVRHLIAAWLEHAPPGALCAESSAALTAIRQKLVRENGEPEHLYFLRIADRIQQRVQRRNKSKMTGAEHVGSMCFEPQLRFVDLGNGNDSRFLTRSQEAQLSQALSELHLLRNCFVHNSGCADGRLVRHCPHMGLHLWQPLEPTYQVVLRYVGASGIFAITLMDRIRCHTSISLSPEPLRPELWTLYGFEP
ncbi:MAG: hypothetical protein NT025_06415 [bacterium]|nr:hypothetical protein [bacterium]